MVNYKKPNCKRFNILFTCIGRRVSLLNSFKKAAKELKLNCRFLGTETTELSSALQLCDKKFIVKSVGHQNYTKQLLEIVKQNNVKLLVPTIDLDLQVLADNREKFTAIGCTVLVSKPNVVNICQDKRETFKFLVKNGFDTPETLTARQAMAKKSLKYPRFLKPWDGYAGRGNAIVKNRQELAFYAKKIPNCIVQEFAQGHEYTCDCFIDFDYQVRCVVPRKRIEVRSGEVSKGQIIKNRVIMAQAAKLTKTLRAGPGVITIQLILAKGRRIEFIEINPRFGGGAPLSIKAGADFPKWILSQLIGKKSRIKFDGFKNNLTMLRYDAEVWLKPYGD
ncbi:MAG: ATP-grasp domain-containing protein [Planctomycetes bacterium]|nr:ATP-grasp domain-containing protein [Planctomycetota bacterium]MBU1518349.1 ATP-grasp domain-containing protein [Planctomycetota bacterium]MBU2458558.1 ATP-grasp domain-containing protein [Planctomycetota bacterium]